MTERSQTTQRMPPMNYLRSLPRAVPEGQCLVHNRVRPAHPLGMNGFRAWLEPPNDTLTSCDCGWASELGQHFKITRSSNNG